MNCSQLHGSSWPIALTPSSANGNSPSPFSGHLPTPRKHVRGIYEEIKGIYTTISPSSLAISTEWNPAAIDPPILLYILILAAPSIGQRAYNVLRKFLSIGAFETFYESSRK